MTKKRSYIRFPKYDDTSVMCSFRTSLSKISRCFGFLLSSENHEEEFSTLPTGEKSATSEATEGTIAHAKQLF